MLPPSIGGLSKDGFLNDKKDNNNEKYDVADELYDNEGRHQRCRLENKKESIPDGRIYIKEIEEYLSSQERENSNNKFQRWLVREKKNKQNNNDSSCTLLGHTDEAWIA